MTTKENYIKRYNDVKQNVIEAMEKALERAIGNNVLDLENMADNYLDVYPLIGAVLQKQTVEYLYGSGDESTSRKQTRKATKYRGDYRIWHDYEGDYRNNV